MEKIPKEVENLAYRFRRSRIAIKAASQLGISQVALFGIYQLGLRIGYYKRITPSHQRTSSVVDPQKSWLVRTDLFPLPDSQNLQKIVDMNSLLSEADEILSGKIRLFGGQPIPLELTTKVPMVHWTDIRDDLEDLKPIWEPARFGWAVTLARAYHLTQKETYAQDFWHKTLEFHQANPLNAGPHWSSAQEVAIRLIALVFAIQVFAHSNYFTPERLGFLSQFVSDHAARIPSTLIYARAQNNNHLVSEAAGLYTAAAALPSHPQSTKWRDLGWKWLNHAYQHQITNDGTYIQHSTNYHRLMLQIALWVALVQQNAFPQDPLPQATIQKLASATHWLLYLLDPVSGQVPNLGPNDGAYILPLSTCAFNDYRPVASSAARRFLVESPLAPGSWDEMSAWYGLDFTPTATEKIPLLNSPKHSAPSTLINGDSWAYLRSVRFTSRPGHADQLHLDLWWRGLNIAQDPGTYRYTAPYPWDNALAHSAVHNTLMVDDQEQMSRAGRFLYLDWAQAPNPTYEHASDDSWHRLVTHHNGYRYLGMTHQRSLTAYVNQDWVITDEVTGQNDRKTHRVRIHWLLPDWKFETQPSAQGVEVKIRILSPYGWISLQIQAIEKGSPTSKESFTWGLVRAGMLLDGAGQVHPTWGWASPTYGEKIPALSFIVTVISKLPIILTSSWTFA
jgi:hypothetical protein